MKLRRLAPLGVAALLLSTTAACGSDSYEVGSVPTTAVELEPGPSEGLHLEAAVDRLETKEYQTVLFAASVEQANREEFLVAAKAEMDRQEAEAEAARARAAEAERQRQAAAARPQRRQSERSASPAPQRQRSASPAPQPRQEAPAPAVSGGSTWDALAQCESGGNWSINTGNGYYGGLQFSASSWRAVGGTGLPHQHSRSTQIAMGERLRSVQGWGAWPACSSKLGLR